MCRQKNLTVLCGLLWLMQACSIESGSILEELELPTFGNDESSGDRTLEVPPNLDLPETKDTYDVASARRGILGVSSNKVLPSRLDMRLRSEGNITWLAVSAAPDSLWPHLTDFWRSYGFEVVGESMLHGRIETGWREQRIGAGGLRVRDMFRMRVERAPNAVTNIYLANRKATFSRGDWSVSFSDHETEVDILHDLSDYLASRSAVDEVNMLPLERIRIALDVNNLGGVPVLTIGQPYSHVWRRLGVTLDRAGLEVRRVDRSRGVYLIRYRAADASDARGSQLLQLRLLEKGASTLVTVHPNRKRGRALPYEIAHQVLQRIVRTYEIRA